MNHILKFASLPFREAVLCMDCESVSNSRGGTCPACGSIAVINLKNLVEKKLKGEKAA
jgi:DNA-directed RNA polymerase subunit RPC12/RpoP